AGEDADESLPVREILFGKGDRKRCLWRRRLWVRFFYSPRDDRGHWAHCVGERVGDRRTFALIDQLEHPAVGTTHPRITEYGVKQLLLRAAREVVVDRQHQVRWIGQAKLC